MNEIMGYEKFKQLFNETIFEKSKAGLLEKIADSPSRYIGLFRPTKPKAKILQNLLQSHEIRFGGAFEHAIEKYLLIKGCEFLPKRFKSRNGEILNIDQCFRKDSKVYFIEQKVRDDHDSTKKRGQIENFEKKLGITSENYSEEELIGIIYFIDPDLAKNKKFYADELEKMTKDYNVETHLFYGKELFDFLKFPEIWIEILTYLEKWKKEIPDLPEINFDLNAEHTFEELKELSPHIFRKLFSEEDIFKQIILTLFPEGKTLNLLLCYFKQQTASIYKTLAKQLETNLEKDKN